MPRSAKCRRVCQMPTHCRFSPERPAHREAVELTLAVFLVEGRPLQIGGGSYALCPQESCRGFSRPCGRCASQDGKEASS